MKPYTQSAAQTMTPRSAADTGIAVLILTCVAIVVALVFIFADITDTRPKFGTVECEDVQAEFIVRTLRDKYLVPEIASAVDAGYIPNLYKETLKQCRPR